MNKGLKCTHNKNWKGTLLNKTGAGKQDSEGSKGEDYYRVGHRQQEVDVNDWTGTDETNRNLNTETNERQAIGVAYQGHVRGESGGSGRHDGLDITIWKNTEDLPEMQN